MPSGITLAIGPYSLDITEFERGDYPRTVINWVTIDQSARGASIRRNTYFRPKHIWTFNAKLAISDWQTLKRMFAYYWTNQGNFTLHDYTLEFEETSPRTRALATGATASDDATTVIYYAQFFAEPTQFPQFRELNKTDDIVSLQFTETGATTA